jgi:hypothetical protein
MSKTKADQMYDFIEKYFAGRHVTGFAIAVHYADHTATWEQETDDPKHMTDVLTSVVDDVNRLRRANLKKEASALGFDLVPRNLEEQ